MKKSLVALAVMAAAGAAMAQSSVQVYGIVDAWVGSERLRVDEGNGLVGVRQTKVDSGGISGSRFGFKGSEDLGGGLKANFLLEQGFAVDNGSAETGKAFSRQAYVGFAGGFGEVKLGKVWTAYDDISGAANSAFDSKFSATSGVFLSNLYTANPANGLYYATPVVGGFGAAISYALGEDKTASQGASKIFAAHVKYESGPLYVGLAYQRDDVGHPSFGGQLGLEGIGDILAADVSKVAFTRLNGSYDFGAAKLLASYGRAKAGEAKANEYHLGVDVPLANNLVLSGGYARSTVKVAGATEAKGGGWGVALGYNLSKRTMAYAGVNNTKWKDGSGAVLAKYDLYAVGVKHSF